MDAVELGAVSAAHRVEPEPPEGELIVLAPLAGSTEPSISTAEFDDLYRREYSAMIRVSYLMVRDEELAVDVTHDAFARVLERWHRLDRPGAYLRTAVINASRDALRRRRFRLSRSHVVAAAEVSNEPTDYLADALGKLPARRRGAIVLRYYLDLPEAEIADALGVRPGTVKSLLHRGLAELRVALTDHQEGSVA